MKILITATLACLLAGCDFELPSQKREKQEAIRREAVRQEQKQTEANETKSVHASLVQFVAAQTEILAEKAKKNKSALAELVDDRMVMSRLLGELSEKNIADNEGTRASALYAMLKDEKLNEIALKYLGTDFAVLRAEFGEKVRRAVRIEKQKKDSLAKNEEEFKKTVADARAKAAQLQLESARAEKQLGQEIEQVEKRRKTLQRRLGLATTKERSVIVSELAMLTDRLGVLRQQYNVAHLVSQRSREQRVADQSTQVMRDSAQRTRERSDAAVLASLKEEQSPYEIAGAYEALTIRKLDAVLLEKNNAAKALDESLDSSLLYLKHALAGSEALDLSGVKRLRTEIDTQLLKFDTSSKKDRKAGK